MSDEIQSEVAMNPATGQLESFAPDAVPQEPITAPPLVRGVALRFLDMEGEASTPDTYEAAIGSGHGRTYNVDLMSDEEVAEYEAFEISADKMEPAEGLKARREFHEKILAVKLKGFDGMKLQPDQRLRNAAVKGRLIVLLLQKSQGAFCATDFGNAENFSLGS